ncbi:hypothetical protein BGP_2186 [Beggiatoa sp. PS]|nr:hypothetical protein BGP_2186 [Beggiatoa sp. PS]
MNVHDISLPSKNNILTVFMLSILLLLTNRKIPPSTPPLPPFGRGFRGREISLTLFKHEKYTSKKAPNQHL